ncbi:hypothetical protein E8E14_006647 [Neopestalotiopsis sp. 37M]|nr:hypothetical protein E8E14_006647 [Neopestalotiopsis sp. 37M]
MIPAMYSLHLWLLAAILLRVGAQSNVTISTFTDNECNTASTITPSVSIPLDACIVTIGMESFQLPTTPCAGGGAPSVLTYGFTDQHCIKSWLYTAGYGKGCRGADSAGEAYGSILLTCRAESDSGQAPSADSTTVTITVGPAATGASSSGTSSGSSNSSGSTTSSGTTGTSSSGSGGDSSDSCSGWSCLSYGERIGVIVAIAVGVPPIIIGIYALRRRFM